ncbi:MAG TPA: hypothetical protein VEX68_26350 [Bryobacteraceae bacterium]|nr:hypothetical protein [Bryobacteraceae bacterium]
MSVRAEGLAELVGDLVLKCTGGTPTAFGSAVPTYQVMITSSVPLTSRVLVPGATNTGLSEALLIVDEPSFSEQIGCATSTSGDGCPAIAGSTNSNILQGRQVQPNMITFRAVPINAPGASGARMLRIANLRANVAALATQSPRGEALQLSVQILDNNGSAVTVRNFDKSSIDAVVGAKVSVRTLADTAPALNGSPVITIPPASLPVGAPQTLTGFNIKYTEGFVGAFRRRNVGTSSESPLFMTVQAVPGLPYNTESGFLNTLLPTVMKMDTAGLADTGTRLWVRFQNVPKDVLIWVTTRDVRAGTTQYSDTSARALLTVADGNGSGPMTPVRPTINGLAQIPVVNGTATAVWEIVSANPATLQEVSFGVAISAQTANPAQGLVNMTAGLAPIVPESGSHTIPMFKQSAVAVPAFAVSNLITVPALICVSAASYVGPDAAPGSIVAGFGRNMDVPSANADNAILPTTLSGASVDLIDTTGAKKSASLLFVSPTQVNFVVANDVESGPVLVNLLMAGRLVASGYIQVSTTAPTLFSANGDGVGVAAGEGLLSSGAGAVGVPMAQYDSKEARWIPTPIKVDSVNELMFLTLYGTGIRGRRNVSQVRATVGGLPVPVTYAGPQGFFSGLDQINIGPLPPALAGKGSVDIQVTIAGQNSNPVQVYIR